MSILTTAMSAGSSGRRTRLVWLLISLGLVLVRALPNLNYPIGRDQATYLVIGEGLLHGQRLYLDLWDNKPPGIFLLYALIVKVFGHVMWSVAVVDILWLLAVSYLIFRFAEKYAGPATAGVAVVWNAFWHCWAGYWEAGQAETFLVLFVLGGYLLMRHEESARWPRHIAAGLLFGAAFWLKYNAVAFLPFLVLFPFLDWSGLDKVPRRLSLILPWRGWLRRVLPLVAGFALALFAVLGFIAFSGAWGAMKEVQFEVLPRYSAMALARTPHYVFWLLGQTEFSLGFATEIAVAAALVVAWRQRELSRLAPLAASAALGYVCVAMQVRFHGYTFETAFPFFSMVWGYLAVKLYQGCRTAARACLTRGWKLARVLVWVVFANLVFWPMPQQVINLGVHYRALAKWWREGHPYYSHYPWLHPVSHYPDQLRVIGYLRANLGPQDGVFVWGSEPLIYFLTARPCPARFVTNLALVSPWSPPAWRGELVDRLRPSPPRFLVVARDDAVPLITYTKLDSEEFLQVFPEFAIFIADYYEPAKDFGSFVLYWRREVK
jgi:hypothetical protein